jgi:MFS family permease
MGPYRDQIIQELGMDEVLHSLLVGSVSLGGLIGCVISGILADTIGRKRAMTVTFSFTTLGWLLVTVSFSSAMIFSG